MISVDIQVRTKKIKKSTRFLSFYIYFACSKTAFVFKVMGHFLTCLMEDLFHLLAKMCNGRYVFAYSVVNNIKTIRCVIVYFPVAVFVYIWNSNCYICFPLILTICKEGIIISIFTNVKEVETQRCIDAPRITKLLNGRASTRKSGFLGANLMAFLPYHTVIK